MTAILAQFLPYIAAAFAALLGIWRLYATGKAAGVNQQKVKEAKARDEEIDRIKRAAGAQPIGGVRSDPNNRDNAKG